MTRPLHEGPGQMLGVTQASLRAVAGTNDAFRPASHPRPEIPARPVYLPPMKGATVREIKVRIGRTVVIFLIDDSGSMYGRYADQTGIRYAAALSMIMLMERSGGGRAGVIHWGTDAPEAMALPPIDVKRGKKALKKALVVPPTLGGNDLPRALERAVELTPILAKTEIVIYYVITDGCEDVTPATHAAIAALPPRTIHMLLVDRCGYCDEAMEAAWSTCAFGSFTRLQTFDTKEMSLQIAQTFATSLGLEMPTQTAPKKETT